MFHIVAKKEKISKRNSKLKNDDNFIEYFSTLSLEKKIEIANENNPVAERLLGTYFHQQHKPEESLMWWKKSAEHGDPISLLHMTQHHIKEPLIAKQYCEEALKQGKMSKDKMLKTHIEDLVNQNLMMVSLSFFSQGIEKFKQNDKEGAKSNWAYAANLNHPEASFYLAKIYLEENNIEMAIYYLELTLYNANDTTEASYYLKDETHRLFRAIYKKEKNIGETSNLQEIKKTTP